MVVLFVLLTGKKSLVYVYSRIWLFFWLCWLKRKVLDITILVLLVEKKSLGRGCSDFVDGRKMQGYDYSGSAH
jgi:hypothetical protein